MTARVLAELLRRSGVDAAPALLGATLTHTTTEGTVAIRLTEVEAYLGSQDPGSHAFRGRTARNAVMFGPAGHVYVYFTYGMHYCLNIVCGVEGSATGVLLRAGSVVAGRELAASRRPAGIPDKDLASGPAKLAQALGIDARHNGRALGLGPAGADHGGADSSRETDGLRLEAPAHMVPPAGIGRGPRVGVGGPGGTEQYPWRFWIVGDPTVSKYRPAVPRRRSAPPG